MLRLVSFERTTVMAEEHCQLRQGLVGKNVEWTKQVSDEHLFTYLSFYGKSFSFCSLNLLLEPDHQK